MLVRADLNVPMKTACHATRSRIERQAPTITNRRQRRARSSCSRISAGRKERDAEGRCKPVAAALARIIGRPVAFADDCIGPVAEAAVAQAEGRRRAAASRTRASMPAKKRTIRLSRAGSPSSATSSSTMRFPPRTARTPRPKALAHLLPAVAGRAMQAELDAISRRRWTIRSARCWRSSAAPRSRPRSSCSAICSNASTCWSSAAAWPTRSSPRKAWRSASRCASTTRSRPRATSSKGEVARARDRAAGRCRGGAEIRGARAVARRRRRRTSAPTT